MYISHIRLKNWRNFRKVDVSLQSRVFLVGPNGCGKSNFLDVFRFLRDIVKNGGGLQQAVLERKGLSKLRYMGARSPEGVEIEVHLSRRMGEKPTWKYAIHFRQSKDDQPAYLIYEKVWEQDALIFNREASNEEEDIDLFTQTHLEQVSVNKEFRDISESFKTISYLHLVPQLTRRAEAFNGFDIPGDPYGKNFIETVSHTKKEEREINLRKIERVLRKAVPRLIRLSYAQDPSGTPHLQIVLDPWRRPEAHFREDQISDGTLRLIGLFWALLEGEGPLLLEEPELSLNSAIVRALPAIIYRLQKRPEGLRQVFASTHSWELLSDEGIGGEEVLLLQPQSDGTEVLVTSDIQNIRYLLQGGLSIGEAVAPSTEPKQFDRPPLFLEDE